MRDWVERVVAASAICLLAPLVLMAARPAGPQWDVPSLLTSAEFRPGSAARSAPAAEGATARWISAGDVPGADTRWADMSRMALADLHDLFTAPDAHGAPAAGVAGRWNYFWPRDGAFVAVALARTGHVVEARSILDFTARLPFDPRHGFDARYLLSGERVVTDPRGPQSDGCGWVLWALGEVAAIDPAAVPRSGDDLRSRCEDHLLALTANGTRLPPPSPDYWEVDVSETSLGTVAPMLAGLRAALTHHRKSGTPDRARLIEVALTELEVRVAERFAPTYQRFGDHGGLDAAVAVLMPPFSPERADVASRWSSYQIVARRPSGGLAPGTGWKRDGTSWTPETALVAFTAAASGQSRVAAYWLDWLDRHRTPWGSLPEKVNVHGDPAGPAPLGWTASLVLLTLDELDQAGPSP